MCVKEEILVSVLMPVYNVQTYVKEAIDSILNQTYTNLELLALYDESSDGTLEILKACASTDKRMKIIMLPHSGIASALNVGLETAGGKYIARMDADDLSLPDRFRIQVTYMEEHPDIGVCGTLMKYFRDDGTWLENNGMAAVNSEEIKAGMLFQCMIAHPTVMFRKETVIKGNWRYHLDVVCEDFDLWSRMMKTVKFGVIPEILLYYRHNPNSLTRARVNDVFVSSCEIVKRTLEQVLEMDTANYKITDFRGSSQVFQLNEPIGENFRRQYRLLHEIYDKNQKLRFCEAEYLARYANHKWKSQFRDFGLSDQCRKESMQIDFAETEHDLSEETVQEVDRIAADLIYEMAIPKKVVLYGAGIRGRKFIERLDYLISSEKLAWKLAGVADKHKTVMAYGEKKINCMKPVELLVLAYDYILVSTDIYYDEIKTELTAIGIPKEKILYAGVLNLLA